MSDSKNGHWVGFDLGGTKMIAAAFSPEFRLLGRRRRPLAIRTTAAATGGALALTLGTLSLVWAGYRVDSFEEPRYTGARSSRTTSARSPGS